MRLFAAFSLLLFTYTGFSQTNQERFLDSLLSTQTSSNGPGLAIGVVHQNELIHSGYAGLANLEYDIPITSETIFGLASITKQMTASCIGILEHRKQLSLEDDVRKHIPELHFFGDTIRIKHLLNHTSGLRNHNVLLNLKGFDYDHEGYTNEMIEELIYLQRGVNHSPGDKMLYSNSNYVLLALIVKRISGKSIPEFSNDELFVPLKMSQTFFKTDIHQVIKNRAHSYYKRDNVYMEPISLTLCVGAGGVGSTIEDMAKWSEILLNKNADFSYLSSFLSSLDTLNNGSANNCARGVFVSDYQGYSTLNHGGRDLGMRSKIVAIPELDLAVIVLTNSEHINADQISYEVLDSFLEPNEKQVTQALTYKHSLEELASFIGDYQEQNSDLLMQITLYNDTVWAQSSFGRAPVALINGEKNSLVREDNLSIVYTIHPTSPEFDLTVDFAGALFYFDKVQLADLEEFNLTEFVGDYFSKELDITYHIGNRDGLPFLSFKNNEDIPLYARRKDELGSNQRTRYSFNRNSKGELVGFHIASESTVKEIEFLKVTSD